MKTMSILLYVFINMKTHGGESHTKTCAVVAITIWQDIVFSTFIIFNNKCTNFFLLVFPFFLKSFVYTRTVSQLT